MHLKRDDLVVSRVPNECSKDVADFISRCLMRETSLRPKAKEIIHFLVQQMVGRAEMEV